jgi:hypothetical protein
MSEWIDTFETMSDEEFIRLYSSAYRKPGIKAVHDQAALGTGYRPNPAGGEAARVEAERIRRGLPEDLEAERIRRAL